MSHSFISRRYELNTLLRNKMGAGCSAGQKTYKHKDAVLSVCTTLDGKYFATGTSDSTPILWSQEDGTFVTAASATTYRGFKGHTGRVYSLCMTLDGKHLITGSNDKTARLWSLEDGTMVREFKGHKGAVSSVCMTVDGKHLITGSWDKTARFWLLDVTEGTPE